MEGSELDGRGLSRQGAISTITMTASIANDPAMPVELIRFDGKNMGAHNLISWSTASETNNNYFTIEGTTDGFNYVELTRVSGAGTSSFTNNYTYSDFEFERKINYYRLSQTDYDGASEVFNLISINNLHASKNIIKVLNVLGQEVDNDYTGLRIIYFSNGEAIKINGKYIANQ